MDGLALFSFSDNLDSKLRRFYLQFLQRHDFESDDLKTLQLKFPNATFYSIPEAWILPIDDFLTDVECVRADVEIKISQDLGFLNVIFVNDNKDFYKEMILSLEKKVYILDLDLHLELEYDMYWENY